MDRKIGSHVLGTKMFPIVFLQRIVHVKNTRPVNKLWHLPHLMSQRVKESLT